MKISSSILEAITSMNIANDFFNVATGSACAAFAPRGAKITLVRMMQPKAAKLM